MDTKKNNEHQEFAYGLLAALRQDLIDMGIGGDESVAGADLTDMMNEYLDRIGNVLKKIPRVQTWLGLRQISLFDAVEVHPMIDDDSGEDLEQACDDPTASVTAFTVFLHLREGGIETVRDFRFDPSEPGAMEAAASEAADCATSLEDMLDVIADEPFERFNYTAESMVAEVETRRASGLQCKMG